MTRELRRNGTLKPNKPIVLIALAAVLAALGWLAYAYLPGSGEGMQPAAPESQAQLEAGAITESLGGDAPGAAPLAAREGDDAEELAQRARELGETRQSELRQLGSSQAPFPHNERMGDYKASLWADIEANPPALVRPGDPTVDAEMAYRLYMYYGVCSNVPRTAQQIDRRLQEMADRAETARRRRLESLGYQADQLADMYELCQAIPPEVDCRLQAMDWMTEAVRLGHEVARVQFYEKAMGFMMRPDPWFGGPPLFLERTELIPQFKATASQALSGALENGHPEAYLAMSEAVLDGVVFARDPVMAMAYARAAELEAMENHVILRNLDKQKQLIGQFLDAEQMADADEMAQRLRESKH